MRTDELIARLAAEVGGADGRRSHRFVFNRLIIGTAVPATAVLFVILFCFAVSPHLGQGIRLTLTFNLAAALVLVIGSFGGAVMLSRPEVDNGPTLALIAAGIIFATGIAIELALVPQRDWLPRLIGTQPLACFVSVFALSLPILVGTLLALRQGAPARPGLAGAFAGLLSGGVTAALYVIHCPEDSLLYIAAWHVPAILLVAGLGAMLGTRVLRW